MNLQTKTIAFLGAGNMAEALIRGLLAAGTVKPANIIATDVRAERRQLFENTFAIRTEVDNAVAGRAADIVVLAVKPQQMTTVLSTLHALRSKLFISIAAGITTARIEKELGGAARIVRVMPNTPALVAAGAAALCRGAHATEDDLAIAEAILGAVGITVRVAEKDLDAVTALSGSGPAYVFYVTEALIKAGIEAGLSAELAQRLAVQTVYGAGKLMADCGEAPAELRRKVTSPGGTTEAALKVMGERKLAEIIGEAVQAAARRSRELAGGQERS